MRLFSKPWYGASLWGENIRTVRASRSLTGGSVFTGGPETQKGARASPGCTVGCIGVGESLTIWLDTPFASQSRALRVLPSLLDVQLPFPLEDCCWCLAASRRGGRRAVSALVVAARREAIQQRLQQYRTVFIEPAVLDHEGLALWWQNLRENPPVTGALRVIVNLEPDHASFIIGRGHDFINAHSLRLAAGAVAPEDIFRRIQRILRTELRPGGQAQWFFCGTLARQPALVNNLHKLLGAEWPGARTIHQPPDDFLARALAARGLLAGGRLCNLRRGDLEHPAARAENDRVGRRTAGLFLAAGILLCLFNLAWTALYQFKISRLKNEIAIVAGQVAPGRPIQYGQETGEAERAVMRRVAEAKPALNVFAKPLSATLAEIVGTCRDAGLSIAELRLSRSEATIKGAAEDWNGCEQLAKRLNNAGYATAIEKHEAGADNFVRFTVKGAAPE